MADELCGLGEGLAEGDGDGEGLVIFIMDSLLQVGPEPVWLYRATLKI